MSAQIGDQGLFQNKVVFDERSSILTKPLCSFNVILAQLDKIMFFV